MGGVKSDLGRDACSTNRHVSSLTRPHKVRSQRRVRLQPCLATPESEGSEDIAADSSRTDPAAPAASVEHGGSNVMVAMGSVLAGVLLFAVPKLGGNDIGLAALESQSVSLDTAYSNGRPTVVEFYADWCEVCREMAPQVYSVESQFSSEVNFVMLNIDNTKWTPEILMFPQCFAQNL
ncbi:hypothetical protein CYMTET_22659 [Cymbomonas tetramitiformis]|uniref:Thioredoxin domain-containing protein n=1 Tax=Cymbomonas tetramitiformis TaxID=36881 RepID=A0AAE0L1P3_9CHLO|nr:hypothetical protein CYMTET_22659 [Cymbomonas tetramitiformis]